VTETEHHVSQRPLAARRGIYRVGARAAALAAVLAAVLLLACSTAHAQGDAPSAQEVAAAEALFQDARALVKAGMLDEACEKFQESQRLDPRLGTLLNLATCHQDQGKTASAWAEFKQAVTLAKQKNKHQRGAFAKRSVAELGEVLSYVVLQAEQVPEGLTIKVGEQEFGAALLDSEFPLDPGEYEIVASAPGRIAHRQTVIVPEGPGSLSIQIPGLEEEGEDVESPVVVDTTDSLSTMQLVGVGAAGVGVIGLGIGTVFGIITFSEQGTVEDHCDGQFCDQEGIDADDAAHTAAAVSTVSLIAGTVLVGAGVVLFFWEDVIAPTDNTSAWVSPSVGPSGASVLAGGRF